MATKNNPLKDFDAPALVQASQNHEQQLKELSDKLSMLESATENVKVLKEKVQALEDRVGDDAKFAKAFASAQANSTVLNSAVDAEIDKYDRHLLIIEGTTLAKWIVALVIGGAAGWLINQALTGASYSNEFNLLREQINQLNTNS